MSKSVLSVIPYNGNRCGNFKEKTTSKDKNLIKLWKSANVKLSLLCNLDNIDVTTNAYGISRKILFHLQKYYNNISLKFFPYLNEKNFFGNVKRSYKFDKCQRNNHLFIKLHNLKKRIRFIRNQKKIGYIKNDLRNPYLSIHRQKNNKEEISSKINSNYAHTWNYKRMQNCTIATTFFPKIEIIETVPLDNIIDLFVNLNLDQVKNNMVITKYKEKCEINNFNLGDTSKKTVQVNFENVLCKTRSIQWSTEVDVIYYAGDMNEGKVIWREMEPLREEAYQQANNNDLGWITLTNKNSISSVNNYQSFDF